MSCLACNRSDPRCRMIGDELLCYGEPTCPRGWHFDHTEPDGPAVYVRETAARAAPAATAAGGNGHAPKPAGAVGGNGDEHASAEPQCEPVLIRLADVQPEPVQWLWPGRIPLGKLTLLAGDPGLGKSFLTLDMAARISTGTPWPDLRTTPNPAGGVVLLSAEDDPADTIRPRLDAAGADVNRIVMLDAVRGADKDGPWKRAFNLQVDLRALVSAIAAVAECRLVVIDPVSAYMPDGRQCDTHRNSDVRAVLAPLAELAAKRCVAVVAVTHLRKGEGPALYRAMGSLAFVAAARSVWGVVRDREDESGKRRLLLPIKCNLAADLGGLAYELHDPGTGVAQVAWENGTVSVAADEALSNHDSSDGESMTEAVAWLEDWLASGPLPAVEVKQRARGDGIAERTLRRAKKKAGVRARRKGYGDQGCWVWELADAQRGPSSPKEATLESTAPFEEAGPLWTDQDHGEQPPDSMYESDLAEVELEP